MSAIGRMITGMPGGYQQYRVGPHLSSGQLADVHLVETVPSSDTPTWVIKLLKPGVVDQSFQDKEFRTLTELRQGLSEKTRSVVPEVLMVTLENHQSGLALEYIDPRYALIEYVKQVETREGTLAKEHAAWEVGMQYTSFISELHRLGYTCNDRKLDDFFYIPDEYGNGGRLVVLDWNVIERLEESSQGAQDVLLFARAWFNLFGGSDESRFHLQSRRLNHISVASREFLWTALSPQRRQKTYVETSRVGFKLQMTLRGLMALFEIPVDELERQLHSRLQTVPLERFGADPDLTLSNDDFLDVWRMADMAHRRNPALAGDILAQIEQMLEETRQQDIKVISRNLEISRVALEQVQSLRVKAASVQRKNLLENWEASIQQILQQASREGLSPETNQRLRKAVTVLQDMLSSYLSETETLTAEIGGMQQVRAIFTDLLQDPNAVPLGKNTHQALHDRQTLIDVYLQYLEGERLLFDGDLETAIEAFHRAAMSVEQLPDRLRKLALNSLPDAPEKVAERLTDAGKELLLETRYARRLTEALAGGQFEEAIRLYESISANPRISASQLAYFGNWVRPAYLVRALKTHELYDLRQAMQTATELALIGRFNPMVNDVLTAYVEVFERHFERLTQPPHRPSSDVLALEIGEHMRVLTALLA